jgi:hypothetical protein
MNEFVFMPFIKAMKCPVVRLEFFADVASPRLLPTPETEITLRY